MKAIVVGAGEVGFHIADRLSREGHAVTLIEQQRSKEANLRDKINGLVLVGSGVSPALLEQAGVASAEIFIAVTDADEVNLVACMLAHQYGVKRKIARIKNVEYLDEDAKLSPVNLGIDLLINPQRVVAEEMLNLVSYAAASEVAEFADGRVVFLGYRIEAKSDLVNVNMRELGDLRGMYQLVVTALERGNQTLIPRGDDEIKAGDIVFFLCKKEDLAPVRVLFGFPVEKAHPKVRRVFILGGGRVGRVLAALLAKRRYRVTLIDRSAENCERLAQELERVEILHADGTDLETLLDEGLASADIFCAVTQHDQTNILCALLAKHNGAARVAALVNEPTLIKLAPTLGVHACISPRLATAAAILKHVRQGEVHSLAMLDRGNAEVLELSVPADSPVTGKTLAELHVPTGSIVGVIVRGEEVIVASGGDRLLAGDHVVVFSLPEAVVAVERFFAAS